MSATQIALCSLNHQREEFRQMGILSTILIGLSCRIIAKFIMPGDNNEPSGFIMTTILGS
jgi:hypothetical protein